MPITSACTFAAASSATAPKNIDAAAAPKSATGAMAPRRISIVRIADQLDPAIELILRFDVVREALRVDRLEGLRLAAALNLDLALVSAFGQIAFHLLGTPHRKP